MKTIIKNAKIVFENEILENSSVLIDNGVIVNISNANFDADVVIDAKGLYLMPGFIDLHCHGGNGLDFMDATPDEMKQIAGFHLKHGTTTLYATTLTDTYQSIEAVLDNYKKLYDERELLTLEGVHLEGPWLSKAQCGAQEPEKISQIDLSKYEEYIKKYSFIKRITIAPELEYANELSLKARKDGIVISAGHTDADFDTVINAKEFGVNLLTHFYSGMRGVIRKNAYREAGAVEAGLYDNDIFVEIIADGKHLPKSLLKLIFKCKGADKICLITDAMRASGLPDGTRSMLGKKVGGTEVVVNNGVAFLPSLDSFAGSVSTFDRLIKTMGEVAEVDIVNISKMASTTPAKIMGLNDRGIIEVGKRADFVLVDKNFNVKNVIFKGELV